MSPRTGRPIDTDTKRTVNLQMRLSDGEAAILDECASLLRTTRSVIVRKGIILVKAELDKKKE